MPVMKISTIAIAAIMTSNAAQRAERDVEASGG
jgi:hypothetical protein